MNSSYDRDFNATGQAVSGKQCYWTIALQSYNQASTLTLQMQITVHYDVLWFDRKLLALS